jgi:predicted membrane protein
MIIKNLKNYLIAISAILIFLTGFFLIGWLVSLLITVILYETYFLYNVVETSNKKLEEEQSAQSETRKRILDLYNYLNMIKESTMYVQDPIVTEIYRQCVGLLDYFDYVYYKEETEKLEKLQLMINELEKITGQKVVLTQQQQSQTNPEDVLGVVKKF